MTRDQLRKAQALDYEINEIRQIIQRIEGTEKFSSYTSTDEGKLGLKKVLKEPYILIVKSFKERIDSLNNEIADL
jgi:outer membrane translocation and assembly module TamA